MDVGATLRGARTAKHLTLEQLSRATKISLSNLRALESNDFERLPATVYTRGFLRAYAREVGLDPDDTVEQHMQQLEEAVALEMAEREQAAAEAASEEASAKAAAATRSQHDWYAGPRSTAAGRASLRSQIDLSRLPLPAIAAAVVVLAIIIGMFAFRGGEETQPLATARAAQHDAAPADVSAPAVSDAARAANVMDDVLRIELKTTGPCWISASADRAPVLARLLQAGESETIEAKNELVLRVGDPSTISVRVNGAPLRPLGRKGVPVTMEINRENYRDLLAS